MRWFTEWRREQFIRKTLRRLARQRVVVVSPDGRWVIERAVQEDGDTRPALITCWMRGWVEPLREGVPSAEFDAGDFRIKRPPGVHPSTVWRLTNSGWGVLHRRQTLVLVGLLAAFLSLALTALGIVLPLYLASI